MSAKKNAKIAEAYMLAKQYPGQKTAILDRLLNATTFTVTVDDFNAYDSLMTQHHVVEPDNIVDEYPDIPGFTQTDKYSDSEVLKIFEARDSFQNVIDTIGAPPTDAEWFQAGKDASQRIAELRPFYETRKAEEWEGLESALPSPFAPLMGPIGFLTELIGGGFDWRHDFKEDLHERGFGTSWNPLTGFGAWDIAEFKQNPLTGEAGFTPELLAMEDELEELYGDRRGFMEEVQKGGYAETLPGSKTMTELDRLNTMISEEQLLDPRMFGEVQ